MVPCGQYVRYKVWTQCNDIEDGLILITGGDFINGTKPLASAELYNPSTGTWSLTGSMNYPHGVGHTATLLAGGKILVAGGQSLIDGSRRVAAFAELYDPSTGTWSLTGDMTEKRTGHKAMLLKDGRVMVVGGASTEIYDPTTGAWSKAGEYSKPHVLDFAAVLLEDGRVLVSGGGEAKEIK